jgi:hypothetical protein
MSTPVVNVGLREGDRLVTQTKQGGASTSNWWTFKPRMLNLADVYDLREVILDGLVVQEDGQVSEADLRKDKLARNMLMNSVANGPMQLIKDCDTASSMWLALQDRFEAHTLASEMQLRYQLTIKRFRIGESFDEHYDNLIGIRDELVAMGVGSQLNDDFMAKQLLQSVPYTEFSTVIDSLDEDDLDLSTVRLKLVTRHNRLVASMAAAKAAATSSSTLTTAMPPAAFVGSAPTSALLPCEHCNRLGHPARWCYQKWTREVVQAQKLAEGLNQDLLYLSHRHQHLLYIDIWVPQLLLLYLRLIHQLMVTTSPLMWVQACLPYSSHLLAHKLYV